MVTLSIVKKKLSIFLHGIDLFVSKKYFKLRTNDEAIIKKESKPYLHTSLDGLPEKAIPILKELNDAEQTEYLYKLNGKYLIEFFYGWVLDQQRKEYLFYSIPYNYLWPLPSFYNLKLKKYKIVKIKKVIPLRYSFHYYWHFFNDLLGQIAYIDKYLDDKDVPILVPKGVLEIPYVRDVINSSTKLRNRKWIVHEYGTIVEAETVILAKSLANSKENFMAILGLFDFKIGEKARLSNRKIFMKRGNNVRRRIANGDEIENMMRNLGFEIIDNELFSFEEQVEIYQSATVVVAIHGSGLTNLIFRHPLTLSLLEIFPSSYISPQYYWLCNQFDYPYHCIVGDDEINDAFYVNPEKILEGLKELGV